VDCPDDVFSIHIAVMKDEGELDGWCK
jgi:hypothetical protein